MIVRILGEGQLEVDDSAADELNDLDAKLEAAVEKNDEAGYRAALDALPRIERLVLALPPLDPKPAPIAGVIAMRRGRKR